MLQKPRADRLCRIALEWNNFAAHNLGKKGSEMVKAKAGDTVKVHYTGKLNDGTIFDTSSGHEPLEFEIGKSTLIPAFEQTVVGMKLGESRTVNISSNEAYGPHREEMVVSVKRQKFPDNIMPYVGLELEVCQRDGRVFPAKITDLSEQSVTLDANHALAGKDLVFDIELVEIT